jgi:hypothetical protein
MSGAILTITTFAGSFSDSQEALYIKEGNTYGIGSDLTINLHHQNLEKKSGVRTNHNRTKNLS